MRAFWNFYLIINTVTIPVSIAIAAISQKPVWFSVSLCSFGLGIALLGYYLYYKQQYYFYHNLGYTKTRLAVMVFGLNLVPAVLSALLFSVL